jgi:hypothetical protein
MIILKSCKHPGLLVARGHTFLYDTGRRVFLDGKADFFAPEEIIPRKQRPDGCQESSFNGAPVSDPACFPCSPSVPGQETGAPQQKTENHRRPM